MIKPDEQTLRAINALKRGSQSEMFDEVMDWLGKSCEKETITAIYSTNDTERKFASGRVQELRYLVKVVEEVKEKLNSIKNRI